ncbi:MAG: hypothetical protein AABX83_03730 [Nanoarchaeota archaeon]
MRKLIIGLFFAALLLLSFVNALEEDFSSSPSIIKVSTKEGENVNYPVNIVNSGKERSLDIHSSGQDFISTDKSDLTINENDVGNFNIILGSDKPGVYVGNVIVSDDNKALKIPIILEVESKNILFDARVRIAPKSLEIEPGAELLVDINVWNIGSSDKRVELEYYITDTKGKIIISDKESLSVQDSLAIKKSFMIPKTAEIGDYVFYTYARQGSSLGTSSLFFYVGDFVSLSPAFSFNFSDYAYFISGIVMVLIVGIFLFNYFTDRKLLQAVEWKKRIFDIKRMGSGNIHEAISKLIYQRELLGKAYEKKYIRKESFEEGGKSIDSSIKSLKKKLL